MNITANCQVVVDILKGNNLITSSGTEKGMELHSVHDTLNLAQLFGFPADKGRAAVFTNGQKVLSHSFTRGRTGHGFVSLLEIKKIVPGHSTSFMLAVGSVHCVGRVSLTNQLGGGG